MSFGADDMESAGVHDPVVFVLCFYLELPENPGPILSRGAIEVVQVIEIHEVLIIDELRLFLG